MNGWKRVYAVLPPRASRLQLFSRRGQRSDTGDVKYLHLDGCTITKSSHAPRNAEQHVHILSIEHPERGVRKLACESPAELHTWWACVCKAARPAGTGAPRSRSRSPSNSWTSPQMIQRALAAERRASPQRSMPGETAADSTAQYTRSLLESVLDDLRSSGTYAYDAKLLSAQGPTVATDLGGHAQSSVRDNPAQNRGRSPRTATTPGAERRASAVLEGQPRESSCGTGLDEHGTPSKLAVALADRDEARHQVRVLLGHVEELTKQKDAAEMLSSTGQSDIAEEAVAALARERKETCRLTEECQALRRQVAELQLVIQDLESEVDTRSREAAEVALQLKLQCEKMHVSSAQKAERVAEEAENSLRVKEATLRGLSQKVEDTKRIMSENEALCAEEMRRMAQRLGQAEEEAHRFQAENIELRKSRATRVRPRLLAVSGVSVDGSRKVACQGCGELMFVEAGTEANLKAGTEGKVHSAEAKMLELLQQEIQKLQRALTLALKAEQEARNEHRQFAAASERATETLQDRIASQLNRLSEAEAEKAIAIAELKFKSSQHVRDSSAIESQLQESKAICKRYSEKFETALRDARPTGMQRIQCNEEIFAQGLPRVLETLLEWILHHVIAIMSSAGTKDQYRKQLEGELVAAHDVQQQQQFLLDAHDAEHHRLSSELQETQSEMMHILDDADEKRLLCEQTGMELSRTRKQLQQVMMEKVDLQEEMKVVYESVEGWLHMDEAVHARKSILRTPSPSKSVQRSSRPTKLVFRTQDMNKERPRTARPSSATNAVNYFRGHLTSRDLSPKKVFMSPNKSDLVRERFYDTQE